MSMQPEVAFHFNVTDKVSYLCRLLRKVRQARMRALVCMPTEVARQLDTALWTSTQDAFVPHAWLHDSEVVIARTPILITDQVAQWPEAEVLIHGLSDMPLAFEQYQKVIELVGLDSAERTAARTRWKTYTSLGHTLQRHDVAQPNGAA